MRKCSTSVIPLIVVFSYLHPLTSANDWFSLMNANYAAVQSGLAQLNNASQALNRSMNQQQQFIQDSFNTMALHLNESIVAMRVLYPQLTLSSNQLSPTTFRAYLTNNMNQFRQSLTDGVMMPAQAIVTSILEAMNDFYNFGSRNANCVQQFAAGLIQPRISVGRLASCLLEDVPFFARLARVVSKAVGSITTMVDVGVAQHGYCSADSVNCTAVLLDGWSTELSAIVGALGNLQSITTYYSNPGQIINKACTAVVNADIQDAIQQVKDRVALCG